MEGDKCNLLSDFTLMK